MKMSYLATYYFSAFQTIFRRDLRFPQTEKKVTMEQNYINASILNGSMRLRSTTRAPFLLSPLCLLTTPCCDGVIIVLNYRFLKLFFIIVILCTLIILLPKYPKTFSSKKTKETSVWKEFS